MAAHPTGPPCNCIVAVLLLVSSINPVVCNMDTYRSDILQHRKLTSTAAEGQVNLSGLLAQICARKQQIAKHVISQDFRSRLHKQQLYYRQHPHLKQGILIVAGGRDMFANAAITVLVLRKHIRCELPIEIVHFGSDEQPQGELLTLLQSLNNTETQSDTTSSNSSSRGLLETEDNATLAGTAEAAAAVGGTGYLYITDALQAAPQSAIPKHHRQLPKLTGFPAKVYALAYVTRFQQVMMLDADSMPLVDPALLLDVTTFQKYGNLFWPDLWWNAWVNSSIYTLVADMPQPPWEGKPHFRLTDSGQILFDRLMHAEVLEYLWLLNSHHEWVYKHMHGDKDTFLVAFAMAGKFHHFKQVSNFVRDAMTCPQHNHEHRYHHLGMIQSMPPKLLVRTITRALTQGQSSSGGGSSSGGKRGSAVSATTVAAAQRLITKRTTVAGLSTTAAANAVHVKPVANATATSPTAANAGTDGLGKRLLGANLADKQQPNDASLAASLRLARPTTRARYLRQSTGPRKRDAHLHVGFPVVLHRASFNGKFFPDCLSVEKDLSRYCEVQFVSVPMTSDQAGHSLKPNMYAFDEQEINTSFFEQHCRQKIASPTQNNTSQSDKQADSSGTNDKHTEKGDDWSSDHGLISNELSDEHSSATSLESGAVGEPRRRRVILQDRHHHQGNSGTSRRSGNIRRKQQRKGSNPSITSRKQHQGSISLSQRHNSHNSDSNVTKEVVSGVLGLPPPEWICDQLTADENEMPMPVMPVDLFKHMHEVLQYSYEAFGEVRRLLKV